MNTGHGTDMMTRAINTAFADASVDAILIDPLTANTHGHRFDQRRDIDGDDGFVHQRSRANRRNRKT